MKATKFLAMILSALICTPAAAPAMIDDPTKEAHLYSFFGFALKKLNVARILPQGRSDELMLVAYHSSHYRGNFVVGTLSSASRARLSAVWADGFNQYWRTQDPSFALSDATRSAHSQRSMSKADAESFMDRVTTAAQLEPSQNGICIHGPTYDFVMRRKGAITHGTLEYCDHPQTSVLVCEFIKGAPCVRGHPVQMPPSWVPPQPRT
jgi:hypothetical protein